MYTLHFTIRSSVFLVVYGWYPCIHTYPRTNVVGSKVKKRPLPLGEIFLLYLYFRTMLNISQIFLYGARKRLDYNKKIKYKEEKEEEDGIDYGICLVGLFLLKADIVALGFGG